MKVILAGKYPARTYEKLRALLPEDSFEVRAVDSEDAYAAMTDAEIMILRIFKAPEAVMERNPKLKMILRWGAGFDSVDIEAAGRRGILVTNTPGANAGAVSELAVMLMLAVGRKLMWHHRDLRDGIWSKSTYTDTSFTLNQKLVGVVGGGNIGRQVAQKVRVFGAQVQYYDPCRLSEDMEQKFGMTYVSLEKLLETSDVISLHVPLNDATRHMISARELDTMKNGVILINTARGGLVDDKALHAAVLCGKVGGAGLDVVEEEPLAPEHPMLNHPGIIVTPHVGGGTADIGDAILPILVEDILTYVESGSANHVVNYRFLK